MDGFSELVRQYIDLVYAAARRQVKDAEMAEDVTQAVFIILQQKFKSIPTGHPLSAWLLKTTSYCAANARRAKLNRDYHERRAGSMAQMQRERGGDDASWQELSPLLDEGLNKLRAKDRDALLLRFFEKKSVREVGVALGISEEAAGKRLARAVDRLRDFFQRRGATVSTAALAGLLVAESTQAAPAALAGSVTAAAGATTAATAATASSAATVAKGALVMMAAEKLKVAAIAAGVLILGVGGGAVVVNSMSSDTVKVSARKAIAAEFAILERRSDWTIQFEGGASATILAINDIAAPGDKSWLPDGAPASDPQVDMPVNVNIPADKRGMQLIVRFDNVGDRAMAAELSPATATASRISPPRGGGGRYLRWVGAVDSALATADLLISVGGQNSVNELQFAPESAGQSGALGDVQYKALREENGEAIVDLVLPPNSIASREIVAVADGREILPKNNIKTPASLQISYTFEVPRSKVQKIIYREGQMETVRLTNVSLRPGERTQVAGMPAAPTFPVQFSDGTVVEILGLRDPATPGKWWTANGLPSTRPVVPNLGGSKVNPTANQQQRNVVLRMTGKLSDQNLMVQFEGSGASATGSTSDGRTMIIDQVSALNKALKTTALELYKSRGPFRVDETFTFTADAATQPAGRIRSVTEAAGKVEAKVRIGKPGTRRDEQVVAILKNGREARATEVGGDAEPGINRHLFNCKLDQVDRVVIRSRDMESVTVNNVVLDPNEPPTAIVVYRQRPVPEKATPVKGKAP